MRIYAHKIGEAVIEVLQNGGISMRSAANILYASKSHLHRLVLKAETSGCTSFLHIRNIGI